MVASGLERVAAELAAVGEPLADVAVVGLPGVARGGQEREQPSLGDPLGLHVARAGRRLLVVEDVAGLVDDDDRGQVHGTFSS